MLMLCQTCSHACAGEFHGQYQGAVRIPIGTGHLTGANSLWGPSAISWNTRQAKILSVEDKLSSLRRLSIAESRMETGGHPPGRTDL